MFYIFRSKVVSQDPDFGLGYMRGQTKCGYIMKVILDMIDEGCNCTLWCDAYRNHQKKSHRIPIDSDESDNEKCRLSDVEKDQLLVGNEKK